MNALVGLGFNSSGLLSASPATRNAARLEMDSMARAALLSESQQAGVTAPTQSTSQSLAKAATSDSTSATGATTSTGSTTASTGSTSQPSDTLDENTFLQLLVTQLQNQDPMQPTDNSQMIAQLAQFASLEQMNNLNTSFTNLSGNVDQLNFIAANSLLGRQITGVDTSGNPVSGVVSRVTMNGSVVQLTVGSQTVSMAGVAGIEPPSTSPSTATSN